MTGGNFSSQKIGQRRMEEGIDIVKMVLEAN